MSDAAPPASRPDGRTLAAVAILLLGGWLAATLAGLLPPPPVPRSIWEQDEAVFASAARQHNLRANAPQLPGFPLWTTAGRAAARLTGLPEDLAMRRLSLAALLAALVPLFVLARRLAGPLPAFAATAAWLALPVTVFYGARAFADPPALPFLLGALAVAGVAPDRRRAGLAGLLAGIALGIRPQLAPPILAALSASLLAGDRPRREKREAATGCAVALAATVSAWFLPLTLDAGGPLEYLKLLAGRAGYVSESLAAAGEALPWTDSFLLRAFATPTQALALLALALVGLLAVAFRRAPAALPIAAAALTWTIQLYAFQNRTLVRYGIGWAAVVLVLAAVGAARLLRHPALAAGAIAAIGLLPSVAPTRALLAAVAEPAPVVRALDALEARLDPDRDLLLGETILWSFLRERESAGRSVVPAREVNGLLPDRNPFAGRRVVALEDRTAGDWQPPGAASRSWEVDAPEVERLAQDRLLRLAADPEAPVFALGTYPPELPLRDRPFRWMTGRAFLFAPPSIDDRVLLLEVEVPDWYRPSPLRLEVLPEGRCLFETSLEPGLHWLRVVVPAGELDPLGSTRLDLRTDRSLVPAVRGLGSDPRWLAYRIRSARWLPAARLLPRDWEWVVAEVGRERIPARLGLAGFHPREEAPGGKVYRWTDGRGVVEIPAAPFAAPPREIRLSALGLPEGSTVRVSLDGVPVGTVRLAGGWFEDRVLPIPARIEPSHALHRIELESTARPGSPSDPRLLGIAVERVALR